MKINPKPTSQSQGNSNQSNNDNLDNIKEQKETDKTKTKNSNTGSSNPSKKSKQSKKRSQKKSGDNSSIDPSNIDNGNSGVNTRITQTDFKTFADQSDVKNELIRLGFDPDNKTIETLRNLGFMGDEHNNKKEFKNIWYVDSNYLVGEDGIFTIDYDKRSFNHYLKRLTERPLIPHTYFNVVNDSSTQSHSIGVSFLTQDMQYIDSYTLPVNGVFKNPDLLGVFGMKTDYGTVNKLEGYIQYIIKEMFESGQLQKRNGYKKTGFVFKNKQPVDYIHLGHPDYLLNYKEQTKGGNFDDWLTTMQKVSTGYPINSFLLACAVASYCKPLMKGTIYNPLINIVAGGNTGKSSEMLALTSLETRPEQQQFKYIDYGSTPVSLEKIFALNNHSFICLDELDKQFNGNKFETAKQIKNILHLLNGASKSRGRPDGGLDFGTVSDNLVFASSNKSILDQKSGDSSENPVYTRMLELDFRDEEIFNLVDNPDKEQAWEQYRNESKNFIEELDQNYGWAVDYITNYIINNSDHLYYAFWRNYNELKENSALLNRTPRKLELFSFVFLGIKILEEAIEPDNPVISQKAREVLYLIIERYKEEESIKENSSIDIYKSLKNLLAQNAGNFMYKGLLYSSESDTQLSQKNYAEEMTRKIQQSSSLIYYGKIHSNQFMTSETDFNGVVSFSPEGVEFLTSKQGLAIEKRELVNALKNLDLIKVDKEGKNTIKLSPKEKAEFQKMGSSIGTRSLNVYLIDDDETERRYKEQKPDEDDPSGNAETEQKAEIEEIEHFVDRNDPYFKYYKGTTPETKTKEDFKQVFNVDPDDLTL